ncbi:MAG TPA: TadE/TadG family type IV pilus assembly protein [Negativicutes bacterium]|nr:TadE/TadG family type IV pilus assembly protein [Negativicutes bacterium]
MQLISRYIRNRRGQAVLEFALILPVFLLMLVGMLEFGVVLHDYITVAEGARAGARAAAVGKDNTTIENAVINATPSLDKSKLTVTITPAAQASRTVDSSATVTVTYPVEVPVTSIPNPFSASGELEILPEIVYITGKAVMRVETQK